MSVPSGGTRALPGPKGLAANVSTIRQLLRDPTPTLDACASVYGRTFALSAGPLRLAVVGDPVHLSDVFTRPTASYKWGFALNVLGFIVGPTSMIVSDGDEHHRRRAAVQPAFARRKLDGWIPMIVAESDRMIDERLLPALAGGGQADIYPMGKDLVLAVTVRAFFGNGLEDRTEEIGAVFDELQAYLELPGIKQIPHRFPGTQRARARAARHRFDRIVDDEVARRRKDLDQSSTAADTGDLLDVFVRDSTLDLAAGEIHDQVNTLIGAGYNTTAASFAWAVHRSLTTPGVWDNLQAEANTAFNDDAPFTGATVDELRYASAVVKEALRLHPAGSFAPRQAVTDIAVGPYLIAKGTLVLWSPYLAGRDHDAWNDPLEFRPERHLDPSPETAASMEAAWVPFGRGSRRCIGFALAQMELTLMLARLAQRVDLHARDVITPNPHGTVVNRPSGGVIVQRVPGASRASLAD